MLPTTTHDLWTLPTGEFMLARYREVVTTVLAYRDAKEKLVRRAAIALLPRLAAFAPERFAATYLPVSTAHLLSILKTPAERGVGEWIQEGAGT
jgi:serine/threonine-protein kinase mTOR